MARNAHPRAIKDIAALGLDERLRLAQTRTDKMVGHVLTAFQMHEANAIALYSRQLVGQIPRSYAARAFRQFQQSMYLFEVIRLAALWDGVGTDRRSIPTVVYLFDHAEIITGLVEAERIEFAALAMPEHAGEAADEAWARRLWEEGRAEIAEVQAAEKRRYLQQAIERSAEVERSPELEALTAFRDRELAHNLDYEELVEPEADANVWRYGTEATILEWTVEIVDLLHRGLNGQAMVWEESKRQSKRNAEQLWNACSFNIPPR